MLPCMHRLRTRAYEKASGFLQWTTRKRKKRKLKRRASSIFLFHSSEHRISVCTSRNMTTKCLTDTFRFGIRMQLAISFKEISAGTSGMAITRVPALQFKACELFGTHAKPLQNLALLKGRNLFVKPLVIESRARENSHKVSAKLRNRRLQKKVNHLVNLGKF